MQIPVIYEKNPSLIIIKEKQIKTAFHLAGRHMGVLVRAGLSLP
jgi:hypothetical protein